MEEEKLNQKIEEALSSLEGFQKAEVSDEAAAFDSILRRINTQKTVQLVPIKTVWLAAASFALMFLLNIGSLFFTKEKGLDGHNTEGGHSAAARVIAQTYFNPLNP